MQHLPVFISVIFVLATCLTVYFFFVAAGRSKIVLTVLLCWLTVQGISALTGFYTHTDTVPPRFVLLVLPPLVAIAALLLTHRGRRFLDKLDGGMLTLLHVVRIPVEMVLFLLFVNKAVPAVMTFEGWNFDVLSGITAVPVYYFGYVKRQLHKNVLLAWNVACVCLLINIVVLAVLSAPFPFQRLAFEQPNVAMLYFPYIWLPCCIVPLVLLSHIAVIRQLLTGKQKDYVDAVHTR